MHPAVKLLAIALLSLLVWAVAVALYSTAVADVLAWAVFAAVVLLTVR